MFALALARSPPWELRSSARDHPTQATRRNSWCVAFCWHSQQGLPLLQWAELALPSAMKKTAGLLKRDADQGDANAQSRSAISTKPVAGGLAKDDREAARLYKLAADQGNAAARNNLGVLYSRY